MSLQTERDIQISRIWIHPFKSASPIEVTKVLVDSRGLQYDRIYMLVEEEKREPGQYKSMSQKRYPMMALLRQTIDDKDVDLARTLTVTDSNTEDQIELPLVPDVSELAQIQTTMPFYPRPLMVWDMGDEPAAFFSRFMRRACRVVYRNPTREVYGPQPETGYRLTNTLFKWVWPRNYFTNLTDAAPLHIITEESLKKLTLMNGGLEVTPARFRPNIMLSGCKAWDEETWKMIEVENVGKIAVTGRCPRCGVPDVDEETGKKDPLNRPGTLLQKLHTTDPSLKWGSRPMFGMWAINLFSGQVISTSTKVRVTQRGYHELFYP
ncbi:hypothetical protein PV10_00426 [Exophiala mesophila]|uniref:MOSC domain-containing protein n=1 Tax=Exophiala mesophila TaxID=212818 RepID=A0A0D1Y7B3_EXOME|nr:uncharacterized protein PV10_00426 [Exophiala mesophila]KIV96581.1 hypothetical protein PV10_00426 [Exophiala mesophila]